MDLSLHVQMVHVISVQQAAPVAPPRTRPTQIHILANAATVEGSKMDMALTVNMVEAKECGEQDAESLHKSFIVNRLSDYKKSFKEGHVEGNVKKETKESSDNACRYCCRIGHGNGSSPEVREKLCPAYGKICGNCGKMNHFKQACRKKKNGAVDYEVKALNKEKGREEQLLIDTKLDEGGALIDAKLNEDGVLINAKIDDGGALIDAKLDEGGVLIDAKIDEGGVLINAKTDDGGAFIDAKLDEGGALIDSKIDEGGTRGGALHPGPAL